MRNVIKFNVITLCMFNVLNVAYAEEQLDQIDVVERIIANEKKPFTEAKAKSTREHVFKETQNIDNVVRSMPGAFTQQDKGSGVLSLNIRGETGFGRANTMVDGVTQTFYSTSMDSGQAGGNSQFGASLDPNFIAGIDLTKGNFSGTNGVNSLYGSANFRTLGVNDVIVGDKDIGFIIKGMTGTNATKPNYMAMAATRKWLDNGGYMGMLYGYSRREISQDYKIGGGGQKIADVGDDFLQQQKKKEFTEAGFVFDQAKGRWMPDMNKNMWACNAPTPSQPEAYPCSYYRNAERRRILQDPEHSPELQKQIDETNAAFERNNDQYRLAPLDPSSIRQSTHSHLVKFEYADDRHTLNLQLRALDNAIGTRKIENRNYQLNYNFNDNGYVDMKLLLAHNVGKSKYPQGSRFTGWEVLKYLETKNTADIFDISNSYTFTLPKDVDLKTTLGFNFFKNEYSKNRFPEELSLFYDGSSQQGGLYDFLGRYKGSKGLLPQKSSILQPSGEQKFQTFYLDTSLTRDIYQLDYSVNLIKYKFNGEYAGYYNSQEDFEKAFGKDSQIYKKYCDPNGGCQIYEPLERRAGHKTSINHSAIFSARLYDYFMPFVGYARTNRMPNIQEMYFSQVSDAGVNTHLKPERASTYQLGFNTFKEGVWKNDDVLGIKVVGYRSDIKNYIHNVWGEWWQGGAPTWAESNGFQFTIAHRNYAKTVKKSGVELELNYDMGRFFTNLSYAYQRTNQPTNYSDASPRPNNASKEDILKQGYGLTRISALPRDYGRLELGSRWFDRKLTVGGAVRYYGESKRASIEEKYIDGTTFEKNALRRHHHAIKETETIEKQPLIFDLYVSYEPIENLILKTEIQNLFDKKYIDPLDAGNDAATQRYYSSVSSAPSQPCSPGELCHTDGHGGKTQSVLNNYARGRTIVFSLSYQF